MAVIPTATKVEDIAPGDTAVIPTIHLCGDIAQGDSAVIPTATKVGDIAPVDTAVIPTATKAVPKPIPLRRVVATFLTISFAPAVVVGCVGGKWYSPTHKGYSF